MLFFTVLTYASVYASMAFAALCLATGLYYMSELAEEYSVMAKRTILYALMTILVVHPLLYLLDRFSLYPLTIGLLSHIMYYQLLRRFPLLSLKSPWLYLSCLGFVYSHYTWYRFFTDPWTPAFDFYQLFGFFFTCVWLVPGALFITLNLSDNSLPGGVDHLGGMSGGMSGGSGIGGHFGAFSSSPSSSPSSSSSMVGGGSNIGGSSIGGNVLGGGRRHNNIISWVNDWLSSFLSKSKRRQNRLPSHLGGMNNFGSDRGFIIDGDRGKHM